MAQTYARIIDAVPNVNNAADRDARFPTPDTYQKVWRIDTSAMEEWSGSAWVVVLSRSDLGDLDIFNVVDYGAVGNGVTDDTAAIQAALAAADAAAGGKVFFPSGVYMTSAPLVMPTSGRITISGPTGWQGGGSRSATIKLMAGANCNMIEVGAVTQWCVRDIELRGQSALQSGTSTAIYVSAASNFSLALVENVSIQDFLTDGVYVGANQRSVFVNQCLIQDSGNDAVNFAASSSDGKVTNSLLGLSGRYGVNLEGIANVVQGCDIYKNGIAGVHLSSARNSVVNNLIDTNEREAIIIDGVGVTVVGNCFDSNSTSANNTYATIDVRDIRAAKVITGNTFTNTSALVNLPTYHIALSVGTYHVEGAGNGMVAGTSVSGFTNAPTRVDHGEPVYLSATAVNPDADGTRSIGDDANALGWRDLVIRTALNEVRGIYLNQTNAAFTASPKLFLKGGTGIAWALRNDAGNLQFLSGGTWNSASGTTRMQLSTGALVPSAALGLNLGSAALPFADTYVRRLWGEGTAHVAGDYALSAGWGNTATVSTVAARDTGGIVSITCNGSGILANPTVTLTYKDGSWTTVPVVVPARADINAPATATFVPTSGTANVAVLTFLGTPVAGTIYTFSFHVIGK